MGIHVDGSSAPALMPTIRALGAALRQPAHAMIRFRRLSLAGSRYASRRPMSFKLGDSLLKCSHMLALRLIARRWLGCDAVLACLEAVGAGPGVVAFLLTIPAAPMNHVSNAYAMTCTDDDMNNLQARSRCLLRGGSSTNTELEFRGSDRLADMLVPPTTSAGATWAPNEADDA